MSTTYDTILSKLLSMFKHEDIYEKGVTEDAYHDIVQEMRAYLDDNPVLSEREGWQTEINRKHGIRVNYDFDFGGAGPNHIRWGLSFRRVSLSE